MKTHVPVGAAILLAFIRQTETGRDDASAYETLYAHKEDRLPVPLTQMTVGDIVDAQKQWSRNWRSSACGAYQFIRKTLISLCKECSLSGTDRFTPDLQDRLAYHLLKRRGYAEFMAGQIDTIEFAKCLAMEWASMPVLSACRGAHRSLQRGQSYYAGDALNRALVRPERFAAIIRKAYEAEHAPEPAREDPAPGTDPRHSASVPTGLDKSHAWAAAVGASLMACVVGAWGHLTAWIGSFF